MLPVPRLWLDEGAGGFLNLGYDAAPVSGSTELACSLDRF